MICQYCSREFEQKKTGPRTRFCSKRCHDNWRQHYVYDAQPKRLKKVCENCGCEYETNREEQKYCSNSCSGHVARVNFNSPKRCAVCGKEFWADAPNRCACSEECKRVWQNRQHQTRRRLRRNQTGDYKDNWLSLEKVYREADGVCGICGLPVPLECDSNDDWARTRDHIKPITLSGEHSYSNCQLAHRICNSIKGQGDNGFHIDWIKMFEADPERWEPRLIRLDELLAKEKAAPPPDL